MVSIVTVLALWRNYETQTKPHTIYLSTTSTTEDPNVVGFPWVDYTPSQYTSTTVTPSVQRPKTASPRPRAASVDPKPAAGRDLGRFWATCYDLRGTTASGYPVGDEEIAVDPAVIPLGTKLNVEGLGEKWARDVGSAVKGHHIDVWRSSCEGWNNPYLEVYVA